MPRDERKPLRAVNTGRIVMVPPATTWVSEIVVKTTSTATGE